MSKNSLPPVEVAARRIHHWYETQAVKSPRVEHLHYTTPTPWKNLDKRCQDEFTQVALNALLALNECLGCEAAAADELAAHLDTNPTKAEPAAKKIITACLTPTPEEEKEND